MANSFIKEKLRIITLLLCVLSLVLIIASPFVHFCSLNANTGIGGIADIQLDADFYLLKVKYNAEAQVDPSGIGGGIINLGDLGGIVEGGNITLDEQEVYYWDEDARERALGLIGLLYGTGKDADYWVNPKTDISDTTRVTVNTHTDFIPWWPEGIAQDITVTLTLNHSDNVKNIRINEVWVEIYTGWNGTSREYENQPSIAWKIKPGDYLTKEGQKKEYKQGVTIKTEWGDRVGIIAMVNITMTDTNDETDGGFQLRPFPSTSHPQEIINIIPITQGQLFSVVLMFVAIPLMLFSLIFIAIAIILTLFGRRRRVHAMFTGAIVSWFAAICFFIGVNSLIDLVKFMKPEWLHWNVLGLLLPIIAGALLFVAFLLNMIYAPKEKPEEEEEEIKFDIGAAISEGEIEGEELPCPECGAMLGPGETVCPKCGEEFEIEEIEEGEEDEEIEGEGEEEPEEEGEEASEEEEGVEGDEEPEEEPKVKKKKRKWRR